MMPKYELDFQLVDGSKPVLLWLREKLSPDARQAIGRAMNEILQRLGPSVCESEWGKRVGNGKIIEFRYRDEDYLFRVYCFQVDPKTLKITNAYDKKSHPSESYEDDQIKLAVQRYTAWFNQQNSDEKQRSKALRDDESRARQGPTRSR